MKFGERQTHAVETDEWPGRGRKKKKKQQRGGGKRRGRWRGTEREGATPHGERVRGTRKGLKGREKEEC